MYKYTRIFAVEATKQASAIQHGTTDGNGTQQLNNRQTIV